ncbi:hypothetical protein Tco_1294952, partial [Tanacetum coccineum]
QHGVECFGCLDVPLVIGFGMVCIPVATKSIRVSGGFGSGFDGENAIVSDWCHNLSGFRMLKGAVFGRHKSGVSLLFVPATDDSPEVPERTVVETILNMSPENKAHYESEKEAIHLLLTGIGDEIYSTIDARKKAHEIKFTSQDGESMESYYFRFYKMMNEMIRNNLTAATMQVNVQFLQQLQPEWSRFVTIVKKQHKLDKVSYHKLFDILEKYQKEVNEIHAEIIAKNANSLALVATAQPHPDPYYQSPKSHKSYAPTSKASPQTRSHATIIHKGKEIAKPITPLSESASEEDSDKKCRKTWH